MDENVFYGLKMAVCGTETESQAVKQDILFYRSVNRIFCFTARQRFMFCRSDFQPVKRAKHELKTAFMVPRFSVICSEQYEDEWVGG